ncbi:hypothetical protein BU15DRAFT_42731 [Melanogaster broomeanus]|nr:hypothetical protein BU15DRAFT_42731 [Melanogaster broomeanus]
MAERTIARPWTAKEDELLANAVVIHGEVDNWKAVALSVPGRTNKACRKASRSRWLHSLSPSVKKTAWTREEDNLLLELYKVHSAKWAVIARDIPGRTDDACSKRYREALDPSLKKDEWTSEEDEKLIDAYKRLGGKWGQVGQELQRSGLGCRNRWRLLERKRTTVPPSDPQGAMSSKITPSATTVQLSPSLDYPNPSAWPPVPMSEHAPYWDDRSSQDDATRSTTLPSLHLSHTRSRSGAGLLREPPPAMQHAQSIPRVVNYAAPFHYTSSSLSSALSSPYHHAVRSDPYYHRSPQPQLDVSVQQALLPSDPLSLSEPRPGYHYVHHHDASLAQVVEMAHGQEHGSEYYHVLPAQRHAHPLSRPPTTAPAETHYLPDHRSPTTTPQLEPRLSRNTPDGYYTSTSVQSSQLVHRTPASSTFRVVSRQRSRSSLPRKRPDSQAPLRLSSDLPATSDPSVKPYACGHESCWPAHAASSRACYCTSRGLSDHNKAAHLDDSGGDRPYRCGLEGCGKSWKSINGLQYHLQISKAHFQFAITSTYVTSYISSLSVPASGEGSTSAEGEDKTKRQYVCPHNNCPNRYKQLSGLRYHLAHGHPTEVPEQLDLVPPALSRKLAEKMRFQGSTASPSEHQTG